MGHSRMHCGLSDIVQHSPLLPEHIDTVPKDKMFMAGKKIYSLFLVTFAVGMISACNSTEKRPAETAPVVRGVQTETVRLESAPQVYQAVGSIHSASTAVLAAQVGGAVTDIRVQPGDPVKRGQLLAVLDDRSEQAQVQGAQAGVNEAVQGEAEVEQALNAAIADRQFAEAT